MHDGKNDLLKYLDGIHPNQEILIDDLAPGGSHGLPGGFSATDNPMGFSIQGGQDPNRVCIFGHLGNGGVALRVSEKASGAFVKGIDLIIAIARLLETGPPTYQKSLVVLGAWWRAQIAQCEPFQVPEPAPQGRAEMEAHVEVCEICKPVFAAFIEAVDAGASIATEAHLRTAIEMAHNDQAGAVAHYQQKAAAHSMTPTNAAKSSRRKPAAEQVTA